MVDASPLLELRKVSAAWDGVDVVHQVSLEVRAGELLTLLGPNGSGKTTLLRTIAGFESPTSGEIRLGGRSLAGVPPHRRAIGLLFQDPALFPRRTVFENVAYAPSLARRPDSEIDTEVARLSRLLDLDPLLDRRPDQLSGGERQRVALARSLAARPALVLLDEPFASVDNEVKATLRAEFRRALRESGTSAIHVTHDRDEGLFLGDRVALMFAGRLETVGPPQAVFERPQNRRVAQFLGYNVVAVGGTLRAILPQDVVAVPAPPGVGAYRLISAGRTGAVHRGILEEATGQRVEVESAAPLPEAPSYRLELHGGVDLPDGVPGSGQPQSPKSRLD